MRERIPCSPGPGSGPCSLVQRDPHVGERDRIKVVDVDTARKKLGLAVRRHELSDQVRANRELCGRESVVSLKLRRWWESNAPSRVKSKSGGMSFPLAILASGSLKSSKKGWIIAARGTSASRP